MDQLNDGTGPASATLATPRRDFLRMAGLGSAAVALAACGMDPSRITQATPASAVAPDAVGGTVTYDFGTDVGVLNFAYAMEQLGQSFYALVTSAAQFGSIFPANEQRILADFLGHETAHRDFFQAALGPAGVLVTPNFSAVNFASRDSVLLTSQNFEDTCVGALNGSGMYLRDAGFLAIAGKLVSVEARQAATVRDLRSPRSGAFAPATFDPALTPQQVVSIVQPFVAETITVINT